MEILIEHNYEDIVDTKYEKMIEEYKDTIKRCVSLCLDEEKILTNNIEIYIRYTDNENIQSINKQYRDIDSPTDVLSFPMYDTFDEIIRQEFKEMPFITFGDIIISIQRVEEQAKEYEHSFERELIYLITHAMFHLLGYDHMDENDKVKMRAKEDKIMNILEIVR